MDTACLTLTGMSRLHLTSWMESEPDALKLQTFEEQLGRCERLDQAYMFVWFATALLMLATISDQPLTRPTSQPDKLRVRELIIVDENGRKRIVIVVPLPLPVVNGKVRKRIRMVAAVSQSKDTDGTERCGIAASDDGSWMLGIDDETCKESLWVAIPSSSPISPSEAPWRSISVTNP